MEVTIRPPSPQSPVYQPIEHSSTVEASAEEEPVPMYHPGSEQPSLVPEQSPESPESYPALQVGEAVPEPIIPNFEQSYAVESPDPSLSGGDIAPAYSTPEHPEHPEHPEPEESEYQSDEPDKSMVDTPIESEEPAAPSYLPVAAPYDAVSTTESSVPTSEGYLPTMKPGYGPSGMPSPSFEDGTSEAASMEDAAKYEAEPVALVESSTSHPETSNEYLPEAEKVEEPSTATNSVTEAYVKPSKSSAETERDYPVESSTSAEVSTHAYGPVQSLEPHVQTSNEYLPKVDPVSQPMYPEKKHKKHEPTEPAAVAEPSYALPVSPAGYQPREHETPSGDEVTYNVDPPKEKETPVAEPASVPSYLPVKSSKLPVVRRKQYPSKAVSVSKTAQASVKATKKYHPETVPVVKTSDAPVVQGKEYSADEVVELKYGAESTTPAVPTDEYAPKMDQVTTASSGPDQPIEPSVEESREYLPKMASLTKSAENHPVTKPTYAPVKMSKQRGKSKKYPVKMAPEAKPSNYPLASETGTHMTGKDNLSKTATKNKHNYIYMAESPKPSSPSESVPEMEPSATIPSTEAPKEYLPKNIPARIGKQRSTKYRPVIKPSYHPVKTAEKVDAPKLLPTYTTAAPSADEPMKKEPSLQLESGTEVIESFPVSTEMIPKAEPAAMSLYAPVGTSKAVYTPVKPSEYHVETKEEDSSHTGQEGTSSEEEVPAPYKAVELSTPSVTTEDEPKIELVTILPYSPADPTESPKETPISYLPEKSPVAKPANTPIKPSKYRVGMKEEHVANKYSVAKVPYTTEHSTEQVTTMVPAESLPMKGSPATPEHAPLKSYESSLDTPNKYSPKAPSRKPNHHSIRPIKTKVVRKKKYRTKTISTGTPAPVTPETSTGKKSEVEPSHESEKSYASPHTSAQSSESTVAPPGEYVPQAAPEHQPPAPAESRTTETHNEYLPKVSIQEEASAEQVPHSEASYLPIESTQSLIPIEEDVAKSESVASLSYLPAQSGSHPTDAATEYLPKDKPEAQVPSEISHNQVGPKESESEPVATPTYLPVQPSEPAVKEYLPTLVTPTGGHSAGVPTESTDLGEALVYSMHSHSVPSVKKKQYPVKAKATKNLEKDMVIPSRVLSSVPTYIPRSTKQLRGSGSAKKAASFILDVPVGIVVPPTYWNKQSPSTNEKGAVKSSYQKSEAHEELIPTKAPMSFHPYGKRAGLKAVKSPERVVPSYIPSTDNPAAVNTPTLAPRSYRKPQYPQGKARQGKKPSDYPGRPKEGASDKSSGSTLAYLPAHSTQVEEASLEEAIAEPSESGAPESYLPTDSILTYKAAHSAQSEVVSETGSSKSYLPAGPAQSYAPIGAASSNSPTIQVGEDVASSKAAPEEHIERFIPSPPSDLLNYKVSSAIIELEEEKVEEVPVPVATVSYSEPLSSEQYPAKPKRKPSNATHQKSIASKSTVVPKATGVNPPPLPSSVEESGAVGNAVDSPIQSISAEAVPRTSKNPGSTLGQQNLDDYDTDYPRHSELPPTDFRCADQKYSGYYADVSTRCQMFHVCHKSQQWSFLCPNGTIFSQEARVCVWWSDFDCSRSLSLYELNSSLFDITALVPPQAYASGYPEAWILRRSLKPSVIERINQQTSMHARLLAI